MNPDSKIAILGYGIEGKAITSYLLNKGYRNISICDRKKELEDVPVPLVQVLMGDEYLQTLNQFDVIFRSPGIPVSAPELERVKSRITSPMQYFFEHNTAFTIGVTGTKGKGTTATLIYEVLKAAGKDVHLGGNIGRSPMEFLDQLQSSSFVVLELSNLQLQDMKCSPDIGVVLNITSDHLDYHRDRNEYVQAKEAIMLYQTEKEVLIVNEDYDTSRLFTERSRAFSLSYSTKHEVRRGAYVNHNTLFLKNRWGSHAVIGKDKVGLIGSHNLENILPAVIVGYHNGVSVETIQQVVQNFTGLPHRLEFVAEIYGVKYYNDSFSTTPETAIAAARSFPIHSAIMLLGGSEKWSDFKELGEEIVARKVRPVIYGQSGPRIKKAILKVDPAYRCYYAFLFEEALKKAKSIAVSGDQILLSPACASFDLFENYKKRGEIFKKLVVNELC